MRSGKRLWIVFMLIGLAAGPLFAAAANNQDEELNFNRAIKESVDNFRILRTDRKSQMNDYVTRVFELQNAGVMEVLPYVNEAVRPESGSARTLKYVDPETKKERNFIQVVAPKFQMAGIEQLVKAFDLAGVTSSPGDTRFFYRMKHRNAGDVNTILRQTELSGEGDSAVDPQTNTLYFRDSQSDFSRGYATVKFMDVPVPQVELEVKIYEIDKDDQWKIGLHWDAWKNMLSGGVFWGDGDLARAAGADGFNTMLGVGGPALAQFLNYVAKQGDAKIITNTRVSVQNGQIATISSLKRIPYQDYTQVLALPNVPVIGDTDWAMKREQSDSPGAPGGPAQFTGLGTELRRQLTAHTDPGTVTGEKSEGIYLTVAPTIGTETLSASITVTVNSLVGFTKLDAPIVSERRTETVATLTPGRVFTLGGMDKETRVVEETGIPLLRDLPGLGQLFRYDVDVARQTQVIVTIKPTVKNQLLYDQMTLGWALVPSSPAVDTAEQPLLKVNPDAHTDAEAADAAFDGTQPPLKWGFSEWESD
ncbi:MAG: hypothetical protein R6V58_11810 [Planctomycetota bacterium]